MSTKPRMRSLLFADTENIQSFRLGDRLVVEQFDDAGRIVKRVTINLTHEIVRSIGIDLLQWQKQQALEATETLKALRGDV